MGYSCRRWMFGRLSQLVDERFCSARARSSRMSQLINNQSVRKGERNWKTSERTHSTKPVMNTWFGEDAFCSMQQNTVQYKRIQRMYCPPTNGATEIHWISHQTERYKLTVQYTRHHHHHPITKSCRIPLMTGDDPNNQHDSTPAHTPLFLYRYPSLTCSGFVLCRVEFIVSNGNQLPPKSWHHWNISEHK
jgi:hypothetical protein